MTRNMTRTGKMLDFTILLALFGKVRFLSPAVLNMFFTNPLSIRLGGFFVDSTRVSRFITFQNFEFDFIILELKT